MSFELKTFFGSKFVLKKWKTLQGTKAKQKLTANSWKENSRKSGQQAILNNQLQKLNQLVDRCKNSSRNDGIRHKIGDFTHFFIFCFLLISIHASLADEVWYWPK